MTNEKFGEELIRDIKSIVRQRNHVSKKYNLQKDTIKRKDALLAQFAGDRVALALEVLRLREKLAWEVTR